MSDSLEKNNYKSIILSENGCSDVKLSLNDFNDKNLLNRRPYFLFIGKNVPRKFLNFAIEVYEKSNIIKTHDFIILGNDTISNIPRKYYTGQNSTKQGVLFFGQVDYYSVQKYIKYSKGCIYPSLHDANPTVFIECLSFGIPVICFNRWGMQSYNYKNIYKVKEYDNINNSISTFIHHIKKIASEKINYENRIKQANQFRKKHSWKKLAHKLFNFYNESI